MQIPKSCLFTATAAFLLFGYFACVYVLPGAKSPLMGYEHSKQKAFDDFLIGGPKTQLLKAFGPPRSIVSSFPREIAYRESDFSAEILAKCVEYVTYRNGGNWFYIFGIDENNIVVLKADGHS